MPLVAAAVNLLYNFLSFSKLPSLRSLLNFKGYSHRAIATATFLP